LYSVIFILKYCTTHPSFLTLSTLLLPLHLPLYDADVSANSTIASYPASVSASQPQSSTWGSRISASDLRDPSFWTVTLFYPCMYSILVDVSVKLFALLALRLTNFENHRTQTTFVNRLVLKVSQGTEMYVCVCVCVRVYVYMYVCVCKGVRGRGREREKEKLNVFFHFLFYQKSSYLPVSPLSTHCTL
jgi:Calcium-activated chloride channel